MQKTRISAFPTIKLAFLGVLIAVMLVPIVIDDVFAAPPPPDTTSPKADITYSSDKQFKAGNTITITATFDEKLLGQPLPKISFSGKFNNSGPFEMTKNGQEYVYEYLITINQNDLVTVSLHDATDKSRNVVESTPNSGSTFQIIKKTSKDLPPTPKFTSSSIVATGGPNGGFGGILKSSEDAKREIYINDLLTLRFDLDENFGKQYTMNLYYGYFKDTSTMNSNYVAHIKYNNGQTDIDDPTGLFTEVNVIPTSFDGREILFFDTKFSRPAHNMDLGIYSWNYERGFQQELTKNAFSIVEKIKTAEPRSIEIGNIEMKKIENYKGVMQKQVSSNEHFEPFLIEEKSNAFFEIESQEIIPKLEAKYTQWSEQQISDKEFVEFISFSINQKLDKVDTEDSQLSDLLVWNESVVKNLESQDRENTQIIIKGTYQYLQTVLD